MLRSANHGKDGLTFRDPFPLCSGSERMVGVRDHTAPVPPVQSARTHVVYVKPERRGRCLQLAYFSHQSEGCRACFKSMRLGSRR